MDQHGGRYNRRTLFAPAPKAPIRPSSTTPAASALWEDGSGNSLTSFPNWIGMLKV
jgi:hypothetical protein